MARLHRENGGRGGRWILARRVPAGVGGRGRVGGGRVVRRPGDLSFEHLPGAVRGTRWGSPVLAGGDGVPVAGQRADGPAVRRREPGGGRVLDHDARRRRRDHAPGCLLLEFGDDGRCRSLREYWHFEGGLLEPPPEWGT